MIRLPNTDLVVRLPLSVPVGRQMGLLRLEIDDWMDKWTELTVQYGARGAGCKFVLLRAWSDRRFLYLRYRAESELSISGRGGLKNEGP